MHVLRAESMHVFNLSRTIHNPGYFRFTCHRYYYLSEPPRYTIHRRFSLSDSQHQDEKLKSNESVMTEDVPGFSFLLSRCSGCVQEWTGCWLPSVLGLIYAAHFRLRHPRPIGSGAPSHVPPRYTSLFNYDDDGPTVRATTTPLWDRHLTPPLQLPYTYIRTYARAGTRVVKNKLSFFNKRISFSFLFVKCLCSRFFFLTCLCRYLDCALVLYDTFSEKRWHTDWPS